MKRVLLALVLATASALAITLHAAADPVGNEQPACGNITDGGAGYHLLSEPQQTVTGSDVLAAPSCKDVSYTLYVTYTSGGREKVKSVTVKGDGVTDFISPSLFQINNVLADAGDFPCAYSETAKGNSVIDRAPDTGCVPLTPDAQPGGSSSWN
jgi:hypothetical protein